MKKTFRQWLFENKMGVKEASEILKVHRTYLHMIFRGERIANMDLITRIRKLTGIRFNAKDLVDKR